MNSRIRLLLVLVLILSACTPGTPAPGTATPAATPDTPGTPTPAPPVLLETPIPTATFVSPGDPITLTLWTTEALAPAPETPAGALLAVQIDTFKNTHPNVYVEVVLKRAHGAGGLLDFLSSAAPVAPDVVPDLMVLDAGEVPAAAARGLLTPLETLLAPEFQNDLYPFARSMGTVSEQLYAVPFAADVQHMANNRLMVVTAPLTWTEVLSSNMRLIFAAGSASNMDATLADYLAAGGTLVDSAGRPHLDAGPLAAVLRYYQAGVANGTLSGEIAQTASPADAWQVYRAGKVGLALVNASLYMAERGSLRTTGVAAPPGPAVQGSGVARAWTWVVPVRNDPTRRQLALELLGWLMSPDNLGAWSEAGAYVPARRAALQAWQAGDPYVSFLNVYLETVWPAPAAEVDALILPALYTAVQAVLVNDVSPEVAAAAAAAKVAP